MVELRILRGGSKAKSRITALVFRRAEFGLFRELLRRIVWDTVLEGREVQESCLFLKIIFSERKNDPS